VVWKQSQAVNLVSHRVQVVKGLEKQGWFGGVTVRYEKRVSKNSYLQKKLQAVTSEKINNIRHLL
jgi:hypothetical protein